MRCPFCGSNNTDVVDSREVEDRNSIRRRRECERCSKRFTTYEHIDVGNITVIKRDDTRESFDRNKILNGIMRACERRPVAREQMEALVDKIEQRIRAKGLKEVSSQRIGDLLVKELFKLDPVAYIRFASVYNNFNSPEEFRAALSLFKKSTRRKGS